MAVKTECQTPGVVYKTSISPEKISIDLLFKQPLGLDEAEAETLDANIHNALELVLARYFTREMIDL